MTNTDNSDQPLEIGQLYGIKPRKQNLRYYHDFNIGVAAIELPLTNSSDDADRDITGIVVALSDSDTVAMVTGLTDTKICLLFSDKVGWLALPTLSLVTLTPLNNQ